MIYIVIKKIDMKEYKQCIDDDKISKDNVSGKYGVSSFNSYSCASLTHSISSSILKLPSYTRAIKTIDEYPLMITHQMIFNLFDTFMHCKHSLCYFLIINHFIHNISKFWYDMIKSCFPTVWMLVQRERWEALLIHISGVDKSWLLFIFCSIRW